MDNWNVQAKALDRNTEIIGPSWEGPITLVFDNTKQTNTKIVSENLNYFDVRRQIAKILLNTWVWWEIYREVTKSLMMEIRSDIIKILEISEMYGQDVIHQSRIEQNINNTLSLISEHIFIYNIDRNDRKLIRNVSYQADLLKQSLDWHIQATIDTLSGLYQRSYVDLINKKDKKYSVIFFDLDSLNLINNCLGHEAWDIYIKTISQMLREHARVKDDWDWIQDKKRDKKRIDFPIRWWWDEFLLLVDTEKLEVLEIVLARFTVSDFVARFINELEKNTKKSLSEEQINTIHKNAWFTFWTALYRENVSIKDLIDEADRNMLSKKSWNGTLHRVKQLISSLKLVDRTKLLQWMTDEFFTTRYKK